MEVQAISPVSQSSSLLRQQSPQPSHRLSHSASFISASVLVFQNGRSPGFCAVLVVMSDP
ncbi:MAG: hypothetical protein BGO06_04100 [Shinella sp. 65-6]|nr:MAG: hypothetical protein BGO06_04100 [Shinella sp. 65-6]